MSPTFEEKIAGSLNNLRAKLAEHDAKIELIIEKITLYRDEIKKVHASLQEKKSQKMRQIYEIVNSG